MAKRARDDICILTLLIRYQCAGWTCFWRTRRSNRDANFEIAILIFFCFRRLTPEQQFFFRGRGSFECNRQRPREPRRAGRNPWPIRCTTVMELFF